MMRVYTVKLAVIVIILIAFQTTTNSASSQLTLGNGNPEWSPSGAYIAFDSNQSGNPDVWLADLATYDLENLTANSDAIDFKPAWSFDGSRISFISNRSGNYDIWVMNIESRNETNLTQSSNYEETTNRWSPDDKHIAIIGSNLIFEDDLLLAQTDGNEYIDFSPNISFSVQRVAWLTDNLLALISGTNELSGIWLFDIQSQQVTNLSDEYVYTNIVASPDGNFLVATARVEGDIDLIVIDTKTGETINISEDVSSADTSPAWSPDGQYIAFASTRSGNEDIWIINKDGSDATNITNDEFFDWSPVWSPDGEKIAYQSNRDNRTDIWIINRDGTDPLNLTGKLVPD